MASGEDILEEAASMERSRWLAESERLTRRLQDAVVSRATPDQEILFVFIARGGLLFLPSVLIVFPQAKICVISCDRSHGITGFMPLPDGHRGLVVVMDAVIATGTTACLVIEFLRQSMPAAQFWSGSISCTDIARARLETERCTVFNQVHDMLSYGAPTLDMDGADAGEIFQGFEDRLRGVPGRTFARIVEAGDENERRAAIHAPVLDLMRSYGPSRVLDLGCGDGALSTRIAEIAAELTGSDPDDEVLQIARAGNTKSNTTFVSWTDLPEEASFDLINICMVLNATENVESLLLQAAKCSAPGARQLWTILHPAFSYDESVNLMRRAFEEGAEEAMTRLGAGYLDPHQYTKTRQGHIITNHHRPLGWYSAFFARHGFAVEALVEPPPQGVGSSRLLPRIIIFVTRLAT